LLRAAGGFSGRGAAALFSRSGGRGTLFGRAAVFAFGRGDSFGRGVLATRSFGRGVFATRSLGRGALFECGCVAAVFTG